MKTMAYTLLTTFATGLFAALVGMYADVQGLKAKEPLKQQQLNRIENKIDNITNYLIESKSVNIIKKRGK